MWGASFFIRQEKEKSDEIFDGFLFAAHGVLGLCRGRHARCENREPVYSVAP